LARTKLPAKIRRLYRTNCGRTDWCEAVGTQIVSDVHSQLSYGYSTIDVVLWRICRLETGNVYNTSSVTHKWWQRSSVRTR